MNQWTVLSTSERLARNVTPVPDTGCLLWTGAADREGYGQIKIRGRQFKAHRIAWERYRGSIPDGMLVCHKCDVPSCVNPEHLFLGTPADNMTDKVEKGRVGRRWHAEKTACPKGHPYSGENLRMYRGKRYCQACLRIWNAGKAERQAKKRMG